MSWTSTQPGSGHLTPPPAAPVQPGDTPPALNPRILAVSFQAGAPTRGAWQTGQAIIDANGSIWQCTAGGQPGTWTQRSTGTAGVASFNGRTGAVTPAAGDYTPTQVGALAVNGPGALIGKTIYAPATPTVIDFNQTTLAALSTANLTVSFTVPPSGAVTARLAGHTTLTGADWVDWALFNHNTTTQVGNTIEVRNSDATGYNTIDIDLTGLTPGAAVQLDWAGATNGAAGAASLVAYAGTGAAPTDGGGPATLKIYAA